MSVAVCCSVLQCDAEQGRKQHAEKDPPNDPRNLLKVPLSMSVVACCSVLQSVAVCCSVLQCVAERGRKGPAKKDPPNHPRGEVGGWGRVPFSRNLMSPTPRRKWYLTTGRRFH